MTVESLKKSICIISAELRIAEQQKVSFGARKYERALLTSLAVALKQATWALERLVENERAKEAAATPSPWSNGKVRRCFETATKTHYFGIEDKDGIIWAGPEVEKEVNRIQSDEATS